MLYIPEVKNNWHSIENGNREEKPFLGAYSYKYTTVKPHYTYLPFFCNLECVYH